MHHEFAGPEGRPCAFALLADHGPQPPGSDRKELGAALKVDHLFCCVGRSTGNAPGRTAIRALGWLAPAEKRSDNLVCVISAT